MKLFILFLVILSTSYCYGQKSHWIDTLVKQKTELIKKSQPYQEIINYRKKIKLYNRLDSMVYDKFDLSEIKDKDTINTTEYYIKYITNDSSKITVFLNGEIDAIHTVKTKENVHLSRQEYTFKKAEYKLFNKVTTGGCVFQSKRIDQKKE